MTAPKFFGAATARAGDGPGWVRLAGELVTALPVAELDGLWCFRPIRRGQVEWGTAVLSRVEGDRRRIYTARYAHTIKGKERGKFQWDLQEVGSGPLDALESLLTQVPARGDEEEPPVPVALADWFTPGQDDDGPREG
jgi:hypothetical protein